MALALVAPSPPTAADGTAGLEGGNGQFQIFVTVGSAFDLAESGRAIPMEVVVTDVHSLPQANVPVLLKSSAGTVTPQRVVTDARGHASFAFSADIREDTLVRITALTDLPGAAQGIHAFSVRVIRLPPPPIYARAEIVSLGIFGGIVAFFSATEHGRHALFAALFPLYTRLKREEVLDHFVRGQVFGVIKTQPGTNFSTIRNLLNLSNGTLSYHLRTLEVQGFVVSGRDGMYKRFFAADAPATAQDGVRVSELQQRLIDRLRADPAAAQRDLAREAGVTQQCVSYNLRMMRKLGLLVKVREDGRHRYLVTAI